MIIELPENISQNHPSKAQRHKNRNFSPSKRRRQVDLLKNEYIRGVQDDRQEIIDDLKAYPPPMMWTISEHVENKRKKHNLPSLPLTSTASIPPTKPLMKPVISESNLKKTDVIRRRKSNIADHETYLAILDNQLP
jgi:hypothetical protein